jgi:glycine betaine/proline transport system substrate-binding protein
MSRVRAVDIIGTNLEGAKYTLAVPQNVYDAGVTSFADIAQYADEFDHLLMA